MKPSNLIIFALLIFFAASCHLVYRIGKHNADKYYAHSMRIADCDGLLNSIFKSEKKERDQQSEASEQRFKDRWLRPSQPDPPGYCISERGTVDRGGQNFALPTHPMTGAAFDVKLGAIIADAPDHTINGVSVFVIRSPVETLFVFDGKQWRALNNQRLSTGAWTNP